MHSFSCIDCWTSVIFVMSVLAFNGQWIAMFKKYILLHIAYNVEGSFLLVGGQRLWQESLLTTHVFTIHSVQFPVQMEQKSQKHGVSVIALVGGLKKAILNVLILKKQLKSFMALVR